MGRGPESRSLGPESRASRGQDETRDPRHRRPEGRGRGGRGWGRAERIEKFSEHLDQKSKAIEIWLKNKEKIVNKRIEVLLEGQEEFPW